VFSEADTLNRGFNTHTHTHTSEGTDPHRWPRLYKTHFDDTPSLNNKYGTHHISQVQTQN